MEPPEKSGRFKPFQRAFSKGVDPENLAEQFAAQFDVRTFGLER
jgi:hypothetical protein